MGHQRIIDVIAMAHRIVRDHLAVRAGERVLIVADPATERAVYLALAGAVLAAGAEYTVALMPTRHAREATHLTAPIESALVASDVLIGVTRSSGAPTYSRKGREAAFSDGEVSQRPRSGTARGVVVVDGPAAGLRGSDPFVLELDGGTVVRVSGTGGRTRQLESVFRSVPCARHLAEIGIGLNASALRSGDFEEEKKALGNVHLGLGDDIFYGGTHACSIHWDLVLYDATVSLDGQALFRDGRLLLPDPSA